MQHDHLVAAGEAVAFTSGGRRMREWVSVELPIAPADNGSWRRLIDDASSYVAELTRRRVAEPSGQ